MFAARQPRGNRHSACLTNGTCRFRPLPMQRLPYQGGGRGVPLQDIATLEHWVPGRFPSRFDLAVGCAFGNRWRASIKRAERPLRARGSRVFNRVREGVLQRCAKQPERYAVIDSSQSLDAVKTQIETALDSHFGLNVLSLNKIPSERRLMYRRNIITEVF